MENPADVRYPVHDLIRRRWSPRAFADRPVEREKLQSLFEAARWAASSYNEQPWVFFVATKDDPAEFNRLLGCLVEGNIQWAQRAPVLAMSVAKLRFDRNGKENRHAMHDVGLATANLVVQATALDLWVHQMAGFDVDKARSVLNVPSGWRPATAIALGYMPRAEELEESVRRRETAARSRRPLEAFVFTGEWGKDSRLFEQPG
jgi:nitroreductase